MSARAAVSESWKVGPRTCTVTLFRPDAGSTVAMTIEWEPTMPSALTDRELSEYRHGRNEALGRAASRLGVSIALLEV